LNIFLIKDFSQSGALWDGRSQSLRGHKKKHLLGKLIFIIFGTIFYL